MTMKISLLALESRTQWPFVEFQDFRVGAPQGSSLRTVMVVVHHPEAASIHLQGWRVDAGDSTIGLGFWEINSTDVQD